MGSPEGTQERISYTTPEGVETVVPIYRAGMPEVFAALQPPDAQPYVMAPVDMPAQHIVEFFTRHVAEVEELRLEMKKRFAKGGYGKCRYLTGDVAYVMGRPFMLRVYPLGEGKMKRAARGRATAKYSVNTDLSVMTLYVVHSKNYDEAKIAFNSYAERVLENNAAHLLHDCCELLRPGLKVPPVHLRDMRGRWSSYDAGALWLSKDLIPYPPDCLVYCIWNEMMPLATIDEEAVAQHYNRVLPGWKAARQMLADRPEPYSLQ
jgi:hypothetical protein